LFGGLLAFQFAEWLGEFLISDFRLAIVEAGAHDGRLAKDILAWLQRRRLALFDRIEYWIIEPSAHRQAWQWETLNEFAPCVRWVTDFRAFGGDSFAAPGNSQSTTCRDSARARRVGNRQSLRGVIFSNELLDAMPVHRLGWDAQRREWFEWGVALDRGKFVWVRLSGRTALLNLPCELLDVLPDGFTTEICLAAEEWWREAAGVLKQGKLLTLDYGLNAEEFFAPQRANGTLRAYHRHHLAADVLANPGEQDLTAHVNFTAIQRAGEEAGLKTDMFAPQTQLLTRIAQRAWQAGSDFGPWTSAHTRQFQTLTHPDHLGRSFRVLVQSK
ncbi:MAG: SAM-dependent methyltransferase, partial [Verrucomicrobia bacterium]|nr:SAM-dependent methyltransferase [Verrucomicrobiota bacterium]